MARSSDLIKRRNDAIRKDYERLRGMRNSGGKRKYTAEHVIYLLSEKYYIATGTIGHIVEGRR